MQIDIDGITMNSADAIPWLFGVHRTARGILLGQHEIRKLPAHVEKPFFVVDVSGEGPTNLSKSWVLPWVRGLAKANGSELVHSSRVQALMRAERNGWVEYLGVEYG